MSRNDILWVIKKQKKYYVLYVCADLDDDEVDCLINPQTKYTYSRSTALILAHDKQKKLGTEYGVRERKF